MKQMTPFNCWTSRVQGQDVLTLIGEIDLSTGPLFDRAAKPLGARLNSTLVFDLSGVTFMDSTGLTVIASTLKRLAPRGSRLRIRGASPMICRLFEITGIYESEYLDLVGADDELPSAASG